MVFSAPRAPLAPNPQFDGHRGWDEYAPFYDWENARTLGRRDVKFWQHLAARAGGRLLELGCGTGRITLPVARTGAPIVGVDRSAPMLARARRRLRRAKLSSAVSLIRADIRALPFLSPGSFQLAMAPYGVLQSLTREIDLAAALASVARALAPGGTFGIDLVADVPAWQEYHRVRRLSGRRRPGGSHVTLIESVRQDRPRRLTIFDEEYIERRGSRRIRRQFSLVFRTLSVPQMARRLERAGFRVTALHGDYDGAPWHPEADVWVMLATRE